MQVTYSAPDIECDGCAVSIRKALTPLPGVESVSVDIHHKQVSVELDDTQTTSAIVSDALVEIGFANETKKVL